MVQRSPPRGGVTWQAVVGPICCILLVVAGLIYAIVIAAKSIDEDRRRQEAAYGLLYDTRCKELGGVKSSARAEVCIVGDTLYTVKPNNYKERIPYVFY